MCSSLAQCLCRTKNICQDYFLYIVQSYNPKIQKKSSDTSKCSIFFFVNNEYELILYFTKTKHFFPNYIQYF